jgi:hypothetical protein
VLTKDEIRTLVNIVTTDPTTHANLFFHSCTTQEFVTTFNAIQTKEKSYYD